MLRKSTSTSIDGARSHHAPVAAVVGGYAKPRETTLAFLRQFARVYHYEPALSPRHGAMVLN